jgi:hypothetical protein
MNVMLDIETLGTKPGSIILSIGACVFDSELPESAWPTFYSVINRKISEGLGLTTDKATLDWWLRQTKDARRVLEEAEDIDAPSLFTVLRNFNAWLQDYQPVVVWGNGSDFDNVLLTAAYTICNMRPNWKFTNNRCFRTLKNIFPGWCLEDRKGVHHNALDDALHQARSAANILGKISSLDFSMV